MNNKYGGDFITFKYRYRKQIIIGLIILISTTILVATAIIKYQDKEDIIVKKDTGPIKTNQNKEEKKEKDTEELYSVDIKGEIYNPGIYSLKKNSRVIDVIKKAGGLTENADTSVINLSKKIEDEMVIIIYSKDQVANFKETKELEALLQDKCLEKDENSLVNNACITNNTNTSSKVNINTASKEELTKISGIGEKKAEDIIKYREENGGFKSIEEIKNIQGIGDTIFAKIKESITI